MSPPFFFRKPFFLASPLVCVGSDATMVSVGSVEVLDVPPLFFFSSLLDILSKGYLTGLEHPWKYSETLCRSVVASDPFLTALEHPLARWSASVLPLLLAEVLEISSNGGVGTSVGIGGGVGCSVGVGTSVGVGGGVKSKEYSMELEVTLVYSETLRAAAVALA